MADNFEWDDPAEVQRPDTEVIERLHRVFQQNEDGARVLEDWGKQFLFAVRADLNPSPYKTGFLEGQAHIVRMIVHAINQVESDL